MWLILALVFVMVVHDSEGLQTPDKYLSIIDTVINGKSENSSWVIKLFSKIEIVDLISPNLQQHVGHFDSYDSRTDTFHVSIESSACASQSSQMTLLCGTNDSVYSIATNGCLTSIEVYSAVFCDLDANATQASPQQQDGQMFPLWVLVVMVAFLLLCIVIKVWRHRQLTNPLIQHASVASELPPCACLELQVANDSSIGFQALPSADVTMGYVMVAVNECPSIPADSPPPQIELSCGFEYEDEIDEEMGCEDGMCQWHLQWSKPHLTSANFDQGVVTTAVAVTP